MLVHDKGHVYFISQDQTSFVRVHPKTYKTEEVPFEGAKAFQIAAIANRVYCIREDGYIEVVYRRGDNLGIKPKPVPGKDIKGVDKGKKIDPDSEEEEEIQEEAIDDNGEIVYLRKVVKIEDISEDTDMDANNMSVIAGSEVGEDDEDEPDESSKNRLRSAQPPLYKEAEKPSTLILISYQLLL